MKFSIPLINDENKESIKEKIEAALRPLNEKHNTNIKVDGTVANAYMKISFTIDDSFTNEIRDDVKAALTEAFK